MDPLSITVAITALCGAMVQVGIATEAAASGWKNAENEIDQAIEQRRKMQELLLYMRTLKAQADCDDDVDPDVLGFLEALEPLRALIDETSAVFPSDGTSSRLKTRLKWICKEKGKKDRIMQKLNSLWNISCLRMKIEVFNSLHKSLVSIEKRQASAEMALLDMRRIMDSNHEADLHGPRPSAGGHIHSKSELTGPKYSTTTKWLLTPGVMLMYSRSSKATQRRYSLFFGAVLGSSRVLLVNWNIFTLCVPSVRVRNIIPSFSPVVQACKTGNAELVDGYLRAGTVSPNVVTQDNYTLLTYAIEARSPDVVQVLLKYEADPNATFGRWQTYALLFNPIVDDHRTYYVHSSPLQVAFQSRQPTIARQLLYRGADIDYISARGWSVISYLWGRGLRDGVYHNSLEFYEMCSANEFTSLQARDTEGWTSLHRAAAYGTRLDVTKLLDLFHASPYAYTKAHSWSPIMVASQFDNLGALEVLAARVTHGFLHSPDANGWTPLHLAAERAAARTMRHLLIHGADPTAKTHHGAAWFPVGLEHRSLTVEEIARDGGDQCIAAYLMALRDTGWSIIACDTITEAKGQWQKQNMQVGEKLLGVSRDHIDGYLRALYDAGINATLSDDAVFWDFDEEVTLVESLSD